MKRHIIFALTVAVLSAASASPAIAEGRHEGGRGEGFHERHFEGRHWEGAHDIRHFEDRHVYVWRSGHWHHGDHDGRFGWWWITAGTWYFYPGPIYPYPDPYIPPVVIQQQTPDSVTPNVPPPAQNWYYCDASKSYYPYVSNCPAGWKTVPATPPKAPVKPPPQPSVPSSDLSY
jgi:hypothetical protein